MAPAGKCRGKYRWNVPASVPVAILLVLASSQFLSPSHALAQSVSVTLMLNAAPQANVVSASNYFTISYTYNGRAQQIHAQGIRATFTADPNTTLTISAMTSSSSSVERWCIVGSIIDNTCNATTFNSGSAATLYKAYSYVDQLSQIISYSARGGAFPTSINSNLVGWWKLGNESGMLVPDSSGKENTGTLANGPALMIGSNCISGNCLNFSSSSSQYVRTGTTNLPTGSQPSSFFAWIYLTDTTSDHVIDSYGNATTNQMRELRVTQTNAHLAFTQYGSDYQSTMVVSTNAWNFVGYTYSGTTLTFYCNGESQSFTVGSLNTVNSKHYIGARIQNLLYFQGRIDDPRVYSIALTSAQELQQYQSYSSPIVNYVTGQSMNELALSDAGQTIWTDRGTTYYTTNPAFPSPTTQRWAADEALTQGLAGYWPFGEESGNSTIDMSGNANTGTLHNLPTWLSGTSCKSDGCLSFSSASSQYVRTGTTNLPTGSQPSSFFAWIYSTDNARANHYDLENYGTAIPNEWREFYIAQTSDVLSFSNDGGSWPSNLVIIPDTWNFVGYTYSDPILTLYDNAQSQSFDVGDLHTALGESYIGANVQNNSFFQGTIDSPRLYFGALSSSQELELRQHISQGKLTSSGSINVVYYNQYPATIISFVDGGSPPPATLAYTEFGKSIVANMTGAGTSYWMDSASTCFFTNPLSNPISNEQWRTETSCNYGGNISAAFTQILVYASQSSNSADYLFLSVIIILVAAFLLLRKADKRRWFSLENSKDGLAKSSPTKQRSPWMPKDAGPRE